MNKFGKILSLYMVVFLLIAVPAFSEAPGLDDLKEKVDVFTDSLAHSLPFNSTMGLNWSDAYIGKLSLIPPAFHIGIGATFGFTTMDIGSLNGLLNMFGVHDFDALDAGGFALPGYTVEIRLGGIIFPFDVGFKFGYFSLTQDFVNGLFQTDIPDLTMDYMLIGGDIRYALLDGKKFPLKFSIGGGFNYLKGGLSMSVPADNLSFMITDDRILYMPPPALGLNWETKTLDFKAQASFKILLLTPYIGIGASHAWSNAGYDVKSEIKVKDAAGNDVPLDDDTKNLIEAAGISGVDGNGFSQINEVTGWSFRAFGGVSINLPLIKFDITGMFDFISKCYGITFGVRLQI
jgi:hypothetical protein